MYLTVFHWIYLLLIAVTLPLYISIIIITAKDWKTNEKQKTINLLIISQGVADLTAIVNYLFCVILRASRLLDKFFWRYQSYYLGTWCFLQYQISDILRALGILLITFHRYVTICCSGSVIERWLNSRNRWILVCVHWILPFAYLIPIIGHEQIKFADPESMDLLLLPSFTWVLNIMSFSFVFPCFFFSCLFFSRILCLLYRNRLNASISFRRQYGVIVHLTGFIVAFTFIAVLYATEAAFPYSPDTCPLRKVRRTHPLATGIFSIVNPWMMLLTATDLRRKLCDFYGIRKNTVHNSSSLIAIKLSKPPNVNTQSRAF